MSFAFSFDASACTGCKACQAACKDKNNLPVGVLWRRVIEVSGGNWVKNGEAWANNVFSYNLTMACNHCVHPKCAGVCPTNAYHVREDGIVILDSSICIGCGYCISGCPFNIPRLRKADSRVYKCTLCSDRVAVGLEPACIKACPTQALSFGSKEDMLVQAQHRLADLNERGFAHAALYNPEGVNGTHVFFVLPHGDRPEAYGLPKNPSISPVVRLWRSSGARGLGVFTMFAVLATGILHYMRYGPLEVPEDNDKEES